MAEPGNASGNRLQVFISYSRDELAFAELDAALGLQNFNVTIDRHGISGGEDWKRRLGNLIRDADTVVFVLSPSSARSDICAWEVEEALRLGKRIIPALPVALGDAKPPTQLADLNYIFFYPETKSPGSGFGMGLVGLVTALNTDLDWLREHTRYLQRATEWDSGGRPAIRLLSGSDIGIAKAWAARRPKDAPALTPLHLDFLRASEQWEAERQSEDRQRLEERERLVQEAEAAQAERNAAARRVVQRTLAGLIVALVLAALASGMGVIAYREQRAAMAQADRALKAQAAAEAATKQVRSSESHLAEANARTNFNEPLSDGGEVRLVEGIGVWNGAGRRMQSSRRARFGRRHKCAIGPVHPYYTDELRFIRWHGNSPCAQPWSVS